jgi:RimJ/RimL family protein N-acetyltransferase
MTNDVTLREVQEADLAVFFEQQLDPEATQMAAFPSRARDAFMTHWAKSMADETINLKTIVFDGKVAGNIVYWEQGGEQRIGYWLGKEYWGKGIASAALSLFLGHWKARPLHARVAKHNLASIRVLKKCGFTIYSEDKFSKGGGKEGEEWLMRLEPNASEITQEDAAHAEPSAPPNGGPATPLGNWGARRGRQR